MSRKVKGIVVSGKGKGKKYVEVYKKKIIEATGMEPYPGTLNLQVRDMPDKAGLKIDSFGGFGEIRLLPCRIYGVEGYAVFPEKSDYKDILEVVLPKDLRSTLGLKNGDEIEIEFD
jgi:riboflavin kinase